MIDAAIFLGALAAALNFSVGVFADRYGPDVSGRFLEINPRYDATSLIDWGHAQSHKSARLHFSGAVSI